MADDLEIDDSGVDEDEAVVSERGKSRTLTPYEESLRRESIKRKERIRALDAELAQVRKAASETAAALEAERKSRADADETARVRLIKAELKAAAVAARIIDPRDLSLLDMTGVKVADDGTVEGAEEMIAAFKKDRPYLFGGDGSTSTPTRGDTPSAAKAAPKNAKDLSPSDRNEALASLGITAFKFRQ